MDSKDICDMFWQSARNSKYLTDNFNRDAYVISLEDTNEHEQTVCYHETLIPDKGWCEVEGSTPQNFKWGFCSRSCQFLYRGQHLPDLPEYMDGKFVNCQRPKHTSVVCEDLLTPLPEKWVFRKTDNNLPMTSSNLEFVNVDKERSKKARLRYQGI